MSADALPCGAKSTTLECHLPHGHDGLHTGLLDLPGGRYAEIAWADEWHADLDAKWLVDATLERDMPMVAVQVFSRGGDLADVDLWANT